MNLDEMKRQSREETSRIWCENLQSWRLMGFRPVTGGAVLPGQDLDLRAMFRQRVVGLLDLVASIRRDFPRLGAEHSAILSEAEAAWQRMLAV